MVLKNLKGHKKFLLFIYVLSFCLQLIFFNFFLRGNKDYFRGDSPEYHQVAVSIASGDGILDGKGRSDYYRVPGYSIFLAPFYKMFNFDIEKTIFFQIFFSSFIPILVFLLSLVFFPSNFFLAKIASLLTALNFGLILYSGFLMSEGVFTIFFLIFCILFFSNFHMFFCDFGTDFFSYKKIFLSGFLLGLATLIRPVGNFVVIIALLTLIFSNLTPVKKFWSSGLIFIAWFAVVSFWIARNFLLTGSVFFHSMSGKHFLFYIATDVKSELDGRSFLETKSELKNRYKEHVKNNRDLLNRKLSGFEKSRIAQDQAVRILLQNPSRTLKWCFINFFKTLFGFHCSVLLDRYSKNFFGYNSLNPILSKLKCYLFPKVENKLLLFLVYYEILFLLFFYSGIIGYLVLSVFNKHMLCVFFQVLPLIALLVFLTLGIGLARLRFPLEPFFTILAAKFWLKFLKAE